MAKTMFSHEGLGEGVERGVTKDVEFDQDDDGDDNEEDDEDGEAGAQGYRQEGAPAVCEFLLFTSHLQRLRCPAGFPGSHWHCRSYAEQDGNSTQVPFFSQLRKPFTIHQP
ncbi:hypothetical protein AMTRI_Chr09g17630 [Amborella trichopoda]|uniref:Uncharacterized protein n=1 Tax=Amborella trichopoda TaxID=13333 RepID=W1PKP6_AMBTC|nr:hypothetical protein AMTR_s00018p00206260 [Amborella trichopoda]